MNRFQPGTKLANGRYELVRFLAKGTFVQAWEAREQSGALVIVLRGKEESFLEIRQDQEYRLRHATTLQKKLRNISYICQILDESDSKDPFYYHVVEDARYVGAGEQPRQNLEDFLRQTRPLPFMESLEMIEQVAELLSLMHDRKIVWNDVRTDNLFWGRDADPKLKAVDLGNGRDLRERDFLFDKGSPTDDVRQTGYMIRFSLLPLVDHTWNMRPEIARLANEAERGEIKTGRALQTKVKAIKRRAERYLWQDFQPAAQLIQGGRLGEIAQGVQAILQQIEAIAPNYPSVKRWLERAIEKRLNQEYMLIQNGGASEIAQLRPLLTELKTIAPDVAVIEQWLSEALQRRLHREDARFQNGEPGEIAQVWTLLKELEGIAPNVTLISQWLSGALERRFKQEAVRIQKGERTDIQDALSVLSSLQRIAPNDSRLQALRAQASSRERWIMRREEMLRADRALAEGNADQALDALRKALNAGLTSDEQNQVERKVLLATAIKENSRLVSLWQSVGVDDFSWWQEVLRTIPPSVWTQTERAILRLVGGGMRRVRVAESLQLRLAYLKIVAPKSANQIASWQQTLYAQTWTLSSLPQLANEYQAVAQGLVHPDGSLPTAPLGLQSIISHLHQWLADSRRATQQAKALGQSFTEAAQARANWDYQNIPLSLKKAERREVGLVERLQRLAKDANQLSKHIEFANQAFREPTRDFVSALDALITAVEYAFQLDPEQFNDWLNELKRQRDGLVKTWQQIEGLINSWQPEEAQNQVKLVIAPLIESTTAGGPLLGTSAAGWLTAHGDLLEALINAKQRLVQGLENLKLGDYRHAQITADHAKKSLQNLWVPRYPNLKPELKKLPLLIDCLENLSAGYQAASVKRKLDDESRHFQTNQITEFGEAYGFTYTLVLACRQAESSNWRELVTEVATIQQKYQGYQAAILIPLEACANAWQLAENRQWRAAANTLKPFSEQMASQSPAWLNDLLSTLRAAVKTLDAVNQAFSPPTIEFVTALDALIAAVEAAFQLDPEQFSGWLNELKRQRDELVKTWQQIEELINSWQPEEAQKQVEQVITPLTTSTTAGGPLLGTSAAAWLMTFRQLPQSLIEAKRQIEDGLAHLKVADYYNASQAAKNASGQLENLFIPLERYPNLDPELKKLPILIDCLENLSAGYRAASVKKELDNESRLFQTPQITQFDTAYGFTYALIEACQQAESHNWAALVKQVDAIGQTYPGYQAEILKPLEACVEAWQLAEALQWQAATKTLKPFSEQTVPQSPVWLNDFFSSLSSKDDKKEQRSDVPLAQATPSKRDAKSKRRVATKPTSTETDEWKLSGPVKGGRALKGNGQSTEQKEAVEEKPAPRRSTLRWGLVFVICIVTLLLIWSIYSIMTSEPDGEALKAACEQVTTFLEEKEPEEALNIYELQLASQEPTYLETVCGWNEGRLINTLAEIYLGLAEAALENGNTEQARDYLYQIAPLGNISLLNENVRSRYEEFQKKLESELTSSQSPRATATRGLSGEIFPSPSPTATVEQSRETATPVFSASRTCTLRNLMAFSPSSSNIYQISGYNIIRIYLKDQANNLDVWLGEIPNMGVASEESTVSVTLTWQFPRMEDLQTTSSNVSYGLKFMGDGNQEGRFYLHTSATDPQEVDLIRVEYPAGTVIKEQTYGKAVSEKVSLQVEYLEQDIVLYLEQEQFVRIPIIPDVNPRIGFWVDASDAERFMLDMTALEACIGQ